MTVFSQDKVFYRETVPGGWNWSQILKKGESLRLVDLQGGACVSLIAYNPREISERYNMPDTLKAQFTARLTTGHALYSDMGRILLSFIADEFGGHDPLGGVLDQAELEDRFGVKRYQEYRNDYYRSGQLSLLSEMAKYNLGYRDWIAPVNFFTRLNVDSQGVFSFDQKAQKPAATIDLQAEMDCLVIFAATQHPLDPRPEWKPKPVEVLLWQSGLPSAQNPVHAYNDQNKRGFINTELYAR